MGWLRRRDSPRERDADARARAQGDAQDRADRAFADQRRRDEEDRLWRDQEDAPAPVPAIAAEELSERMKGGLRLPPTTTRVRGTAGSSTPGAMLEFLVELEEAAATPVNPHRTQPPHPATSRPRSARGRRCPAQARADARPSPLSAVVSRQRLEAPVRLRAMKEKG